jgi:hypothetical protein
VRFFLDDVSDRCQCVRISVYLKQPEQSQQPYHSQHPQIEREYEREIEWQYRQQIHYRHERKYIPHARFHFTPVLIRIVCRPNSQDILHGKNHEGNRFDHRKYILGGNVHVVKCTCDDYQDVNDDKKDYGHVKYLAWRVALFGGVYYIVYPAFYFFHDSLPFHQHILHALDFPDSAIVPEYISFDLASERQPDVE